MVLTVIFMLTNYVMYLHLLDESSDMVVSTY